LPRLGGSGRWAIARDLPIIALTAHALLEDQEKSRAAGANEHLSKPIDRKELLRLVAKWSGSGRAPAAASNSRGAVES